MIPHAERLAPALTARTLPIPVVQTPFGTLAMATSRPPQAVTAGEARAGPSAIDVAAIAVVADREDRLAAGAPDQTPDCVLCHPRPRTDRRGSPSESAENVRQSEMGERLP